MFITKRALSRRTVLRGMGAAVALPLLDAMVPAIATARELAPILPKSRFTGIEMVHGSAGATEYGTKNHLWSPSTVGRDFEFTKTLQPLEPFRDYLTVISHTDCSAADPVSAEEVGADHFRSSAVFLTAAHAKQTEGSDIRNGTSIDQLYAQTHGQDTPLPSIQLCIENLDSSGTCGYNYSCAYMDTISWGDPATPLPMTRDPRLAFEELFEGQAGHRPIAPIAIASTAASSTASRATSRSCSATSTPRTAAASPTTSRTSARSNDGSRRSRPTTPPTAPSASCRRRRSDRKSVV